MDAKEKELLELFKAIGYVAGEVQEISKDGIGLEDLLSIKDLIDNKELLEQGFKVEGNFVEILKANFSYEQLVGIIAAAKAGYDLGLK